MFFVVNPIYVCMLNFEVLGYILLLAPIFFLTPQIVRTIKTKNIDGLSITSQIGWIFSWGIWGLYGLYVGSFPVFLNNALGFITDTILLIFIFLIALKTQTLKNIFVNEGKHILVIFLFIPIIIVYFVFGFDVAILLLAVTDFVILLPQFLVTLSKKSLAGLSIWTWGIKVLVGLGWLVYGFGMGIPLSVGWAFLMLPLQVIILVKILYDRFKVLR